MSEQRVSTGVKELDAALGGGLLPGTLTVVVGATGIGKTQLGIQFIHSGGPQEGQHGVILDFTARGDSQNHAAYAKRISQWTLEEQEPPPRDRLGDLISGAHSVGDYLPMVIQRGRRVARAEMSDDEWRDWQAEWNREMQRITAFLYGAFVQGRRRFIVDGVEPAVGDFDSAQMHLFDHLYHKVIRQDPEWVARELFREQYLRFADAVRENTYSPEAITGMMLVTTTELMLDPLIESPPVKKDLIANANTVILMGKTRSGGEIGRALYIAKHRGSACRDAILPYTIEERGLRLLA